MKTSIKPKKVKTDPRKRLIDNRVQNILDDIREDCNRVVTSVEQHYPTWPSLYRNVGMVACVSPATVDNFLNGVSRHPRFGTVYRIASALGVDVVAWEFGKPYIGVGELLSPLLKEAHETADR